MLNFVKMLVVVAVFALCLPGGAQAKRLLFVPMDDRPVCLEYTVDTLKAAGWEVVIPPRELVASRYRMGEPDKMMDWLEKEAPTADAAVVSSDALIYGGLVASRTHEYGEDVLAKRAQRLTGLKDKQLDLRLYAFSTIMRTPRASSGGVEPPYYEKWGPEIFRWSALTDKSGLDGLKKKEQAELAALTEKLPKDIMADWLGRRQKNLAVNEFLVNSMKKGSFNYFVMGKDDTAPFSQSHKDARLLEEATDSKDLYNYKMFVGADQLGLILLNRAVNDQLLARPYVAVKYAKGIGGKMVPGYEDGPVGKAIESHIYASGGFPARRDEQASMFLYVNTPLKGSSKEAGGAANTYEMDKNTAAFLRDVKKALDSGKKVAVADIVFSNGSSNALVTGLFEDKTAYRLDAYAGWNTASNTIGYALGQGLLMPYIKTPAHDRLITIRYLDEWAYQANVRSALNKEVLGIMKISGTQLDGSKESLGENARERIVQLASGYMEKSHLAGLQVEMPWNRMFEARIYFEPLPFRRTLRPTIVTVE